ncbi:spore coat protein [Bacillaceae bacterium IKA-2]|nr:spore coat protein [Bacillaceae bacterium IKA-2]
MNQIIEKLTGMTPMTDQVIATDMVLAAKSAIKNYSLAITETASKDVRETLIEHLEAEIKFHQKISIYMINQGYYFPYDTDKQLQVDIKTVESALNLMEN